MPIPRYQLTDSWPLLSAGFRPFFLGAGLWACFSMVLWVCMLGGLVELPTAFSPVVWHFHEMLFGFVAAAIAGFLLTAIPNWTGRLPLQGWPLGSLVILWILGRLAVAGSAWTGPVVAAGIDLAFLVTFAVLVGREIIAGKNWRNLPILIALALLIVANTLIHSGTVGRVDLQEIGERLSISVIVMLISLIGGRIIPSFTGNWLRKHEELALPASFSVLDKAALLISIAALAPWIVAGMNAVVGGALILAGTAHAVRLARWRGTATIAEPLLWILHIGYAWLPVGLILLGATVWLPEIGSTAFHALTVGGMGTMIIAVITRASLGHSKRELTAGYGTMALYILILIAGVTRALAPFLDDGYLLALEIAAGSWILAFALFVILYGPLLVRR